ncbi:MAG: ABC transporter ATP-binding protein, partial [Alphaproteobacteria bacterium]|nr:ABC transporter ATP-binding protein [Alphaproteobacteria bacterium]
MSTNVFKFLWKYLSKLKFLAFSVLLSVILGEISARVGLYYASQIIETISQSLPKSELIHIAAGFAFLASVFLLLKGVLVNVVIFIEANFLPRYGALIAKDLFSYAHKHSTAFFAEEMAGNISAKIKTMVDSSTNIYYNLLWGFISPLVVMCVTFGFIFHINIELGLLMLVLNSILIWCIYILSRRLAPYSEKRAKLMSEANGCLIDSITNASLVKNFCNYIFEKNLYFKELRKAAEADKQETIQFGKLYLAQGISRAVLEAIFLALPLWYWFQDKINIGQLVLIQTLIISLSGVYNMLSMQFMHFLKLYGGISDGLKLLSRPYEIIDVPNAKNLKLNTGKIDFCHLDYHYKNSEALFNDFSLQIKAGEKIGLVGRSGSGKSTLIKLLARHYDLQGGEICIDGQNIALVKQDSLRKYIA